MRLGFRVAAWAAAGAGAGALMACRYKLTFLIHAPLELFLIVGLFAQKRHYQDDYNELKFLVDNHHLWVDGMPPPEASP